MACGNSYSIPSLQPAPGMLIVNGCDDSHFAANLMRLLEGAVHVRDKVLNLPGQLLSIKPSTDVLLMTCGDQGQNHASVSLYSAAFGSAKLCTYLIAEDIP